MATDRQKVRRTTLMIGALVLLLLLVLVPSLLVGSCRDIGTGEAITAPTEPGGPAPNGAPGVNPVPQATE